MNLIKIIPVHVCILGTEQDLDTPMDSPGETDTMALLLLLQDIKGTLFLSAVILYYSNLQLHGFYLYFN